MICSFPVALGKLKTTVKVQVGKKERKRDPMQPGELCSSQTYLPNKLPTAATYKAPVGQALQP